MSALGALPPGQARDQLVAEVRRVLQDLPEGSAAVVATSGGPDSTALAVLADEARPDLMLHLVHVMHGLRTPEIDDRDADAVRALGALLGRPVQVERVTVVQSGQGPEAAAREARYARLRQVARAVRASHILVGHTADDQAETVVMRIARGTGLEGLAAMRPVAADVIRPLLRLRRPDVRAFVAGEGLPAVGDPANEDPRFQRVRVRAQVMPALEGLAGDPVGALARLADLAADDEAALTAAARLVAEQAVVTIGPVSALRERDVAAVPEALLRRLLRGLLQVATPGVTPTADHVETVRLLADGAAFDLAGLRISRGGGWWAMGPIDPPEPEHVRVVVPGRTEWKPLGLAMEAAVGEDGGQLALPVAGLPPGDPADLAVIPGTDPDRLTVMLGPTDEEGLALRGPRAGDRIATPAGTRKLQDVFVDAGVPRVLRPLLPILVRDDEILWVPGVAVDAGLLTRGRRAPTAGLRMLSA